MVGREIARQPLSKNRRTTDASRVLLPSAHLSLDYCWRRSCRACAPHSGGPHHLPNMGADGARRTSSVALHGTLEALTSRLRTWALRLLSVNYPAAIWRDMPSSPSIEATDRQW